MGWTDYKDSYLGGFSIFLQQCGHGEEWEESMSVRRACQGRGDTQGRVSKQGPPNNRVRMVEVVGQP